MTPFDVLSAALAGAPALMGARCRGRSHLFDEAAPNENPDVVQARHAQALGLCQHCPALVRCQEWVNELPSGKRPMGVVGGKVRSSRNAAGTGST